MSEQTQGIQASFDVDTEEGMMKVFNAQAGASISLKKLDHETVIPCTGAMIYNDTVDVYGEPKETQISVLFGEDGLAYASVSESVAKAVSGLISLWKKTNADVYKIKLIKQKSAKGQEFLNIQLSI